MLNNTSFGFVIIYSAKNSHFASCWLFDYCWNRFYTYDTKSKLRRIFMWQCLMYSLFCTSRFCLDNSFNRKNISAFIYLSLPLFACDCQENQTVKSHASFTEYYQNGQWWQKKRRNVAPHLFTSSFFNSLEPGNYDVKSVTFLKSKFI